jgi:hypothetical protein
LEPFARTFKKALEHSSGIRVKIYSGFTEGHHSRAECCGREKHNLQFLRVTRLGPCPFLENFREDFANISERHLESEIDADNP